MKITTIISLCAGIFLLSGSLQADSQVPFKARFHGFAEAPVPTQENPRIVQIVVPLHGVGTHLGPFDEHLVHFLNLDTGEFTGFADWTAANGDTFTTVFAGRIHPTNDPNVVSFEVAHSIVDGTGRFRNATGFFLGVNGLFNPATGEDQGGYEGSISFR